MSDKGWTFERAYQRVLGLKHRTVGMVHGSGRVSDWVCLRKE